MIQSREFFEKRYPNTLEALLQELSASRAAELTQQLSEGMTESDFLNFTDTGIEFEDAVKPLMKWLADNHHPHTSVIVTSTSAELVEGTKLLVTEEFIHE